MAVTGMFDDGYEIDRISQAYGLTPRQRADRLNHMVAKLFHKLWGIGIG